MTAPDHPVLVYVASTGRSGSTLLEMLLASHPQITTVGELLTLPHLWRDPTAACACGRLVRDCPFWAGLVEAGVLPDPVPVDPFREQRHAGRLLRPRLAVEVLSGRVGRRTRRDARAYALPTERVATAAATGDRSRFVVDASKDPYRLHLLRSAGTDVRVVLLVRDPRAFVYSMGAADDGAPGAWRRVIRRSVRWSVQNILFEAQRRRPVDHRADGTFLVRYEDLASKPDEVLSALGRWLGVEPAGFDPARFRQYPNHALAGNPTRARTEGIEVDLRWTRHLAPRRAAVVWALTGFVARRLGYRWR